MLIHLIPGVAADRRLFMDLELPGHELRPLELPAMPEGSTMPEYASELAGAVERSVPHVLLGVSMGGMIAQELASRTEPAAVIIISSWKDPDEMPGPLKLLRGTHPERVVTMKFIERVLPMLYWQMGAETDRDRELVHSFVHTMPVEQIKRQLHASLNWEGAGLLKDLIHIHGDNDHLMPLADINGAIAVKGGGHLMVFNKAAEVSRLVMAHLTELQP
jgi:pimeloyl-ACP methyl ester carboxylesterase